MIKAEISTIEEEFEELEKGRGKDKRPRKRRGTANDKGGKVHWSDQKGPMIVAGRYLPESEANAYREDYKAYKRKVAASSSA